MRVSERMRYDLVTQRVHDSKEANTHAMDRLSSQKEITKLSDNPIGAAQAVKLRDAVAGIKQFQTNIEYSKGFLERTETAMQSLSDNLIRAKELAVAMSNDTYDHNSRDATSREIREIMDEVVQVANTTFNGRYIFAGFRNQTPPLSIDGQYLGDDGSIFCEVSPGNFRQVNLSGRELFESTQEDRKKGHFDMLQSLQVLYEGLQNDDKTMIHAGLNELDHQLDKATSSHATLGAMSNSMDGTNKRLQSEEVMMRGRLSKVQDTDVYDATSEFKRTESVLQSTLQASTKVLQPSLMNFLQ